MALRLGDAAWLAILAYEVCCPPEETLSRALDRQLARGRPLGWLIEAAIFYMALHCANRLPVGYDLAEHVHEAVWRLRVVPKRVRRDSCAPC